MDINITIGVTPQLEKALLGLAALGKTVKLEEVKQGPSQPASQPEQQVSSQPVQQNQQAPVQQQPQQAPQSQSVPTSVPTYTMDQLAVAATQLVDAGKRETLIQLLGEFGAHALTELSPEKYGAFATRLRDMGAKI